MKPDQIISGPVVTRVPRQPITPTPYALHAANAAWSTIIVGV